MSVWIRLVYEVLPLVTSVIVPLGVLLHYWRRADARPVPARPAPTEGAPVPPWTSAARAQLRRTRVAGILATAAVLASSFGLISPNRWGMEWHDFLTPLLSVLLCTAVLLTRPPAMRRYATPTASAGSEPHGTRPAHPPISLGARWWFAAWGIAMTVLVLSVVWAGLLSAPDGNGDYTLHSVELGQTTGSTSIAGWYFGVPVIISALLVAALVLSALRWQATPPLAADAGQDIWLRRAATRSLLSLSGGAVVVTLGWVLLSIGNAAQMTLSGPSAEDGGMVTVGSPLAPIGVVVRVLGLLLQGVGLALMLLSLFSRLAPRPELARHDEPTVGHPEPETVAS
ncbi:hypothetical protein EV379_0784 [Microterricola gilva]|uniref:Uncharacterized protein n=1 Tax=Microterricola gilva TaxID=393267 RepID=A0A4Q8AJE7_9MICO|nr:hypothetical protein [Microterricola gilva]RZU64488.1 hypothetical protein EV379_0784 [Microterricola gilva]